MASRKRTIGSASAGHFCLRHDHWSYTVDTAGDRRVTHASCSWRLALPRRRYGMDSGICHRFRRDGVPAFAVPLGSAICRALLGQFMLAVVLIATVVHCERSTFTGYDARSIYALKSRVIYDTGSVRGEDFTDPISREFQSGLSVVSAVAGGANLLAGRRRCGSRIEADVRRLCRLARRGFGGRAAAI